MIINSPNPNAALYRSVAANEEFERRERRLRLISTVAMVLIFPVVAAFHIMAVIVFLSD